MRVVDTSAWIEWLSASALSERIIPHLPELAQWVVPTVVQYELAKWCSRENVDEERRREIIGFSTTCLVWPLTSAAALAAAGLYRSSGLRAVDALVYAAAQELDADLLTCDGHFKDLPNVIYIPKRDEKSGGQP